MKLEFNFEPVEITPKGSKTSMKFRLEEHTSEEFDVYMERSSLAADRAISELNLVNDKIRSKDYQNLDPEKFKELQAVLEDSSLELVASILIPEAGGSRVDSAWVKKNLSWPMREAILNKQNELDGVEKVKDQSFLVQKALRANYLYTKQALEQHRLSVAIPDQTPASLLSSLLPNSADSPELEQLMTQEPQEQPEHVSIDELETDEDGLVPL